MSRHEIAEGYYVSVLVETSFWCSYPHLLICSVVRGPASETLMVARDVAFGCGVVGMFRLIVLMG